MQKKRMIITDSAGSIDSQLAERLKGSYEDVGIDNFSSGKMECGHIMKADLLFDKLDLHFKSVGRIFHFAANPTKKPFANY